VIIIHVAQYMLGVMKQLKKLRIGCEDCYLKLTTNSELFGTIFVILEAMKK